MKKWLSRAVVLAMIVAMMIPMPVAAAKSSGGGKLVASVTYYDVDGSGQGWQISSKESFKYGKGNIPTEVTNTGYTTYLGVPVSGWSNVNKIKSTKKSIKSYDSAGFINEKSAVKAGKVVSWTQEDKSSFKDVKDGKVFDNATIKATVGHAAYFKNGLPRTADQSVSYVDSSDNSYAYTDSSVYAWTQKGGVPSLMYATSVRTGKDQYGDNDGTPFTRYAIFNAKGLVLEEGYVDDEGKNQPWTVFNYTMKKGKVDTAVIYTFNEENKLEPFKMLKFKYTNKSVSKAFNLRMMNDLVGEWVDFNDFIWY